MGIKGKTMKKILFLAIFTMVGQVVFSQSEIMRLLSMGFNTKHEQIYEQRGTISSYHFYHFFGYEDYSEALIYYNWLQLGLGEMTFYPFNRITYGLGPYQYRRYSVQGNIIGYEWFNPGVEYSGEEQKFENGKLVYWALTKERRPFVTAERIEQNAESITIYFKNYQIKYYNISKEELLDIFLKKYIELICDVNDIINGKYDVDNFNEKLLELLNGRTPRELAIFRNCLYAIKGYSFASSTWTYFFTKYLEGYTAQFSNAEVTAMFNNKEKQLLNLIIQHENQR